jgi:hypothetical protein
LYSLNALLKKRFTCFHRRLCICPDGGRGSHSTPHIHILRGIRLRIVMNLSAKYMSLFLCFSSFEIFKSKSCTYPPSIINPSTPTSVSHTECFACHVLPASVSHADSLACHVLPTSVSHTGSVACHMLPPVRDTDLCSVSPILAHMSLLLLRM